MAREQLVSVGGLIDEVHATLCVYAPDLNPKTVSLVLGCEPTRSHQRGEALGARRIPTSTGAWLLEAVTTSSDQLEPQIDELLGLVTSDLQAWARLLRDHEIRISCTLNIREWSRGFVLSAGALKALADRGIALDCTIYYVGEDDA
jgi:hypothetical protein